MLVITFPEKIDFAAATHLSQQMRETLFPESVEFDLTKTDSIHSSFIGFLILAKYLMNKRGVSLHLRISPHIRRVFDMLELNSFFFASPDSVRLIA